MRLFVTLLLLLPLRSILVLPPRLPPEVGVVGMGRDRVLRPKDEIGLIWERLERVGLVVVLVEVGRKLKFNKLVGKFAKVSKVEEDEEEDNTGSKEEVDNDKEEVLFNVLSVLLLVLLFSWLLKGAKDNKLGVVKEI